MEVIGPTDNHTSQKLDFRRGSVPISWTIKDALEDMWYRLRVPKEKRERNQDKAFEFLGAFASFLNADPILIARRLTLQRYQLSALLFLLSETAEKRTHLIRVEGKKNPNSSHPIMQLTHDARNFPILFETDEDTGEKMSRLTHLLSSLSPYIAGKIVRTTTLWDTACETPMRFSMWGRVARHPAESTSYIFLPQKATTQQVLIAEGTETEAMIKFGFAADIRDCGDRVIFTKDFEEVHRRIIYIYLGSFTYEGSDGSVTYHCYGNNYLYHQKDRPVGPVGIPSTETVPVTND